MTATLILSCVLALALGGAVGFALRRAEVERLRERSRGALMAHPDRGMEQKDAGHGGPPRVETARRSALDHRDR
jgi:hypothetical protein